MSILMLEKAIDLASRQDEEHPQLAEIYNCMGVAYGRKIDFRMAEYYFELAVKTAKKTLAAHNPDVKR
ncbi:unnamed protein product, partial [Didymodactylos carnosus]